MPIEFTARAGFLKRDGGNRQFGRENVAMRAAIEVNHTFLEERAAPEMVERIDQ